MLGPLLFIIYTNDLPNSLKYTKCILFADDTTIYLSGENVHQLKIHIESDLVELDDWFRSNKLSLNVQKTHFMIFNHNKQRYIDIDSIKIGHENIQRVGHAKFLGIWVDDELEWDKHIEHVSKKIASGTYAINSSKRILSIPNLKLLYFSLVHSHLSYGTLIWGSAYKYKLHRLEIKQKQCMRNICNAKYNTETLSLFKDLRILKFIDIRQMQLGKLIYTCIHGMAPLPVCAIFTVNNDIHNYNTRRRLDPHIEARSSNRMSRTFVYNAPQFWLDLPNEIKIANTLSCFNSRIKKYIIQSY